MSFRIVELLLKLKCGSEFMLSFDSHPVLLGFNCNETTHCPTTPLEIHLSNFLTAQLAKRKCPLQTSSGILSKPSPKPFRLLYIVPAGTTVWPLVDRLARSGNRPEAIELHLFIFTHLHPSFVFLEIGVTMGSPIVIKINLSPLSRYRFSLKIQANLQVLITNLAIDFDFLRDFIQLVRLPRMAFPLLQTGKVGGSLHLHAWSVLRHGWSRVGWSRSLHLHTWISETNDRMSQVMDDVTYCTLALNIRLY